MVLNHLFEGSVLGFLYLEDLIHLEVNTISFQGRSVMEFGLLIIIIGHEAGFYQNMGG